MAQALSMERIAYSTRPAAEQWKLVVWHSFLSLGNKDPGNDYLFQSRSYH